MSMDWCAGEVPDYFKAAYMGLLARASVSFNTTIKESYLDIFIVDCFLKVMVEHATMAKSCILAFLPASVPACEQGDLVSPTSSS